MRLFAFALREYDELGYFKELADQLGFDYGWTSDYPTQDNIDLARGADGVSIITNPMDATLLDRLADLGIHGLATRSIGYDHIDVAHALEQGIRVAHAAYPPEGVANYAIMLMMMAARKMKLIGQLSAAQDFTLKGKIGLDLSSATVGIIGTGRIGATVARHLSGFGSSLLAYDPYPNQNLEDLVSYVSLEQLLASSDIITLHAPGLPENRHMIDAKAFSTMKDGVIIVNAARGSLIDTDALIDALEVGKVGAAALDTIEEEAGLYYLDRAGEVLPNRRRAELLALPNVIVTPHMAFYTAEAVRGMVESTTSALLAFAKGEASPYEIG